MKGFLSKYGVLVAFLVLFFISAAWKPDMFLKPENLRNIINQNVPVGILAVGMTFVIITGGIDLSVGSMIAFVGGLGLTILNRQIGGGTPELTAAMIAAGSMIGLGAFAGLVQGLIVAYGRVTPFVTTLIGMLAFRSMTLALANGGEVRSQSTEVWPAWGSDGIHLPFIKIAEGRMDLVITYAILAFFVVIALASFILNKTRYGRYAIAVGANERAARYSAIPVERIKILTYVLSGVAVGIAAIFLSGRMNSVASGSQGLFFELDAIAAVVIGGTSLRGGFGRIWGTFVGVLLLGVINNMLIFAGVGSHWQGVVKGLVILLAVLLQRERRDV